MSKIYHPDVNTHRDGSAKAKSQAAFIAVSDAFRVLNDPLARREYDFKLGGGK